MTAGNLIVHQLDDRGDWRGSSFTLPGTWLAAVNGPVDVHVTTLLPRAVRGNHFHRDRRELLIVVFRDAWSVHWDTGEDTTVVCTTFEGSGAVLLEVPPLVSHAVRNDGSADLNIFGLCDQAYSPASPDAFTRKVVAE